MGSALIGGEDSGLTKEQGIIWKASDVLAFSPLNCYETSAGSETVASVSISSSVSITSVSLLLFKLIYRALHLTDMTVL